MSETIAPLEPQEPTAQQLRELRQQMQFLQSRIEQVERRLQIKAPVFQSPAARQGTPPQAASPQAAPPLSPTPPAPREMPPLPVKPQTPPQLRDFSAPVVVPKPREITAEMLLKMAQDNPQPQSAAPVPLPVVPPVARPLQAEAQTETPGFEAVSPAPQPIEEKEETERRNTYVRPEKPELPERTSIDWENLIGGKWALWVGTFSLFLAVASFLAYTWRHLPPPPPWAKVAMGFGFGAAFIIAGGFSRSRAQRWFSEGLSGAGLAICYLSLWAGAQVFHLLPFEAAFGAMAALTALGVFLAVRYDALSLSVLSTLGGFLTPVLLRSGGTGSATTALLIYIAVLNAGILGVSLFKRWRTLTWISLAATIVLLAGWANQTNMALLRWPSFAFLTLYFLLFLGAACFYSLARREQTADEDLLLLFSVSSIYALSGYALIAPALGTLPGTFPLTLSLFYASLGAAVRMQAPQNIPLRYSVGGLALLALTVTVPMQLKHPWLPIGWTVEAGVLLLLSRRLNSLLLRRAGQIVWGLSLWPLATALFDSPAQPNILLVNSRALPLLISVIMAAWVALDAHFAARDSENVSARDELAPLYAMVAVWGGAWLLAQETYFAFSLRGTPSDKSWQPAALFVISCLCSIYALATVRLSISWGHPIIRLNAFLVALLAAALPLWTGVSQATPNWTPFWNLRLMAFAVTTVVWIQMGRMIARSREELAVEEVETLGVWPVIASILALAGASLEIYGGFERWHHAGNQQWQASAFFALAMLWCSFAALLALIGCAWKHLQLRIFSYVIGTCALGALLLDAAFSGIITAPLLNLRFGSFALFTTALLFAAIALSRHDSALEGWEQELPSGFLATASLLALWGLTQETYEISNYYRAVLGQNWINTAFYAIAMLWSGFAVLLTHLGCRHEQAALRTIAYLVIGGAAALLLCNAIAPVAAGAPLFNVRFAAFAFCAVSLVAIASRLRKEQQLPDSEVSLPAQFGLGATLLMVWACTQETYETCSYFRAALGEHWRLVAWFLIATLWQCGATALLLTGLRRNKASWRTAAYLMGGAGAAILFFASLNAIHLDWTPFLNTRWLAFVATALAWSIAAFQARALRIEEEINLLRPVGLLAMAIFGWGLTQETYETCYFLRETLGRNWDSPAQMAISVVWSLYGALLLIGGVYKRYQPVRLTALCLLAATVIKVFIFDLSFLDGALRMLSLAGLGISLIFISWLYGRYGTGAVEKKNSVLDDGLQRTN